MTSKVTWSHDAQNNLGLEMEILHWRGVGTISSTSLRDFVIGIMLAISRIDDIKAYKKVVVSHVFPNIVDWMDQHGIIMEETKPLSKIIFTFLILVKSISLNFWAINKWWFF